MKSTILLLMTVVVLNYVYAQDSTLTAVPKGKAFTAHVFKLDGSVQKGILLSAGNNGISVGNDKKNLTNGATITPEQIDKLYLRRKGSVGKGALFGALAGAGIGAIIGAATNNESDNCNSCIISWTYTKEEAAILGGTIGLLSGAGLGMIIGSVAKKKFIIHGKRENYKAHYNDIVEKAMTRQ